MSGTCASWAAPASGSSTSRPASVDELSIHLVPVLFHRGTRMFDNLGENHIKLEILEVIHTPAATHLRYAVRK